MPREVTGSEGLKAHHADEQWSPCSALQEFFINTEELPM